MTLEPNRAEAERFLTALDPNAKRWTFQTFDDSRERGDKSLVRVLHSSLTKCWSQLVKLNALGAGIFITVNETDFKGRTAENIRSVRALFVDLDGSPLDPVLAEGALPPHIITETSPGRWHAYWCTLVFEVCLDEFTPLQKSIAADFGGDPTVHDLPRVMRLPGFVHHKGEPFLSRIERINSMPEYCAPAIFAAFPLVADDDPAAPTASGKSKRKSSRWGELNERALKAESLPRWVPQIFPTATRTRHGGYRVASADLGRGFEEDLSIDPRGIRWFGIGDQGDKRKGRRTAVETVAEFQQVEAPQAAEWLEQILDSSGNGQDGDPQPAPPEPPPEEPATDIDVEITRLAKLKIDEYEGQRKAAAERLGFRASILDRLVAAKRAELGLDGADDGKQGHAIEFPDPEPWPEPVNGAELLNDIAKAIGAHVIMAEHSRDAGALWVAHTYLLDCFMISPRLGINSPTKGCGKTTFLDVIGQLVLRALSAANVSSSAIFRVIEACRPTLLIDEADSFLKDNEELRGVLNSGHRRGGGVLRTVAVGDDFEVRSFSTYGACAIALIGQLPGTLADRSVPIVLTRRKRDEAITPFRLDRVERLVVLARKLSRWTKDNAEAIATIEPEMPAGLYNRAADNWRPLLAIATVAGGDWLARGHKAALASAGADVDEVSRLELLLGDFRDTIFPEVGLDEISSARVIEKLVEIVPRPWAEYGKSGKPITQNKLARLLKAVGITPQQIRVGVDKNGKDIQVRGYRKVDFQEAFERFLPNEGASNRHTVTNPDEMGTSAGFQSVTASKPCDTLESARNPITTGVCDTVTVGKGGNGDARVSSPSAGGVGISARHIQRLTDEYQNRAYANAQQTGGDTCTAECDAWLRQKLADEGVRPEHIEIEFERVMAVVFRS